MEIKTSQSYQKEILTKYKKEKGGEMNNFLANPTRKNIREACLWLLDRRKEKNDEYILNRFFQFKEGEDKARHIQGLKSEKADKFIPVINYLKGKTNDTSDENLELISWLIDFKPRPLREYLKSKNSISEVDDSKPEIIYEQEGVDSIDVDRLERKKEEERKNLEEVKRKEKKKKPRRIITISISVAFGITMLILGIQNWILNIQKNSPNGGECMTWADSLYVEVSCNTGPFSNYGTKVEPLDPIRFTNFKKVEVNAAYQFFTEKTEKPLIWYYKSKEGEIEYFTAPGLHPITGETLRKITPYIIQTYVPIHMDKKSSFVQ